MKKKVVICLALITMGLLLIAARPRPCKTRAECFYLAVFTVTPMPGETPIQTSPMPIQQPCDTTYPNSYLLGTCAHATLESVLATWEVNHPSYPAPLAPPTGYP